MLDWLKRDPSAEARIDLADRTLPIVIRRMPQARRLILRLAPDGSEVRISMPTWGRTQDALDFARSRAAWLERQLASLPQAAALAGGSTFPYRGRTVAITHVPGASRRVRVDGDVLLIGGPVETLSPRLRRWLAGEARDLMQADLAEYCARAELPVPRLALSSAQRRWGSCSAKGEVRLNWRLVMAPDFVRRSVVAHEVAHLVHFDHSPRFHALLSDLFEGSVAEANSWLRREGRRLYTVLG